MFATRSASARVRASSDGSGPRLIVVSRALAASARHASSNGSPSIREVMINTAGYCATVAVSLARCASVG